jgi:hypothetical protein
MAALPGAAKDGEAASMTTLMPPPPRRSPGSQIHFAVAKTPEGPMLFYRWLSPADRRPSHWSAVALEDMPVVLPVLGKAGWTLTLAHVPPPTEGMAYRWETAGGRAHGGMIRAETMMASTPESPFVLYVPGVG